MVRRSEIGKKVARPEKVSPERGASALESSGLTRY